MSISKPRSLNDFFGLRYPCDRHVGYWLQLHSNEDRAYLPVVRGEESINKPFRMKIQLGRHFTDFLGNGCGFLVVSQRVVDLWLQHCFTGWNPFSVHLYDKKDTHISSHQYYGVAVVGRAGSHDTSKGVTKWHTRPDGTKSVFGMNGLYFDVRKWDGSDFFMLEGMNRILVTSRVVESLKKASITGWEATPVLEIRF